MQWQSNIILRLEIDDTQMENSNQQNVKENKKKEIGYFKIEGPAYTPKNRTNAILTLVYRKQSTKNKRNTHTFTHTHHKVDKMSHHHGGITPNTQIHSHTHKLQSSHSFSISRLFHAIHSFRLFVYFLSIDLVYLHDLRAIEREKLAELMCVCVCLCFLDCINSQLHIVFNSPHIGRLTNHLSLCICILHVSLLFNFLFSLA